MQPAIYVTTPLRKSGLDPHEQTGKHPLAAGYFRVEPAAADQDAAGR